MRSMLLLGVGLLTMLVTSGNSLALVEFLDIGIAAGEVASELASDQVTMIFADAEAKADFLDPTATTPPLVRMGSAAVADEYELVGQTFDAAFCANSGKLSSTVDIARACALAWANAVIEA